MGKHKVFISYYHKDDQKYKNELITLNNLYNLFNDYSIRENEINDEGKTSETIRRIIRDEYIREATVLVLLCGENTKYRKHIDWEIHAAMFDTEKNPKMGILVINLPSTKQRNQYQFCPGGDSEKQFFQQGIQWCNLPTNIGDLEIFFPYMPLRIIDNIARQDVKISVVNWDWIVCNPNNLIQLIDINFNRRKNNQYDHSRELRRNNS